MRALERLDSPARRALCLVYWNGMTQAEAAAELAVPVATVRMHIARGLRLVAASVTVSGAE
ncbi:MAG: sigma factor-like helix-turn-helix DNA-binding protein [Jatrophihabitantaceae bacterium]